MVCEIINVGTEIILGDILNTHARFLSKALADLGINVFYHQSCTDNEGRLLSAFETAYNRSDIIILTGGLGPTTDDLTKQAIAKYLNIPLELDELALKSISDYFAKRNRVMTKNNEQQAFVFKGGQVFYNNHGTAPGVSVEVNNKHIILLPGPPRELIPMFNDDVMPYLSKLSNKKLVSKTIRVIGLGESLIEEMLKTIVVSENPTVALYAKDYEVFIRVTQMCQNDNIDDMNNIDMLNNMVNKIKSILGNNAYGYDDDSLASVVVDLLKEKNLKLATAESCTGGLLSATITSISGSSSVFECGIVSYGNNIKEKILNVDNGVLNKHGAVSEDTAKKMALGVTSLCGADIGVSITGIAGPTGGTEEKPVGCVFIGVCYKNEVRAEKFIFGHNNKSNQRDYIRLQAVMTALNMVRLMLI